MWLFKFNHYSFVFEPGVSIWPGYFSQREKILHSVCIKLRKEIGDQKLLSIEENNYYCSLFLTEPRFFLSMDNLLLSNLLEQLVQNCLAYYFKILITIYCYNSIGVSLCSVQIRPFDFSKEF